MGNSCCPQGFEDIIIPVEIRNGFKTKKFIIPESKFKFKGNLVPFDSTSDAVKVTKSSYSGDQKDNEKINVSDLVIKFKLHDEKELEEVIKCLNNEEKKQIDQIASLDFNEKIKHLNKLEVNRIEEIKKGLSEETAKKILVPFRLNQGYKVEYNEDNVFMKLEPVDSKSKSKPKESFFISKFSFFILLLATSSAIYAYYVGADVTTIFSAVLMCICPCIFVLTDTSLKQVGLLMLRRQGIVCNSEDRFWEIMKMVPNSDLVSDKHGTLTPVDPNNNEREEGYRNGVDSSDGIKVCGQKVRVITGGNATKHEEHLTNKDGFKHENNFIYLCNGPNDKPVVDMDHCISIAVNNSPATLKNSTDFASVDSNKELNFFAKGLYKTSKKLLVSRYFMYFLGLGYALTIVPLTIVGEISEMWACLSMCIACLSIVLLSMIVNILTNNFRKIKENTKSAKEKALKALAKMGWIDEKGVFFSNVYSKSVINSQAIFAGIKRNNFSLKWFFGIFVLTVLLVMSYLNYDFIDLILGYSILPVISIVVFLLLSKKVYDIKMLLFVVGSSGALGMQHLIKQYMLPEKLNIISLAIICLMLVALLKFPLDMLQMQFSVILILGSLSLFDVISIHSDHLIIMAIALLLTDLLRSQVDIGTRSPLTEEEVPDFASVEDICTAVPKCCGQCNTSCRCD